MMIWRTWVVVAAVLVAMSCTIPMQNSGVTSYGNGYQLPQRDEQLIARLCTDPNFAYEAGVNEGQQRRPLDTSWAVRCDPGWQNTLRDNYQRGYALGLQNAPIVVQAQPQLRSRYIYGGGYNSGAASAGAYTAGSECKFLSDCGEGRSCRRDSQAGVDVCMGGGFSGDACWFSSDCTSGRCDSNRCE